MTFLLPFTFLLLTLTLIVVGLVLTFKNNKVGPTFIYLSIIPMMLFGMSLLCHTTENEDLKYIQKARLHAEYIEAGIVSDLDEYTYFCNQVVKANNAILEARENKDNIWNGYCYFESVANQELITLDIKKNE